MLLLSLSSFHFIEVMQAKFCAEPTTYYYNFFFFQVLIDLGACGCPLANHFRWLFSFFHNIKYKY